MDDLKHKKIIGKGLEKIEPGSRLMDTAISLYENFSEKNTLEVVMTSLMLGINMKKGHPLKEAAKDLFPEKNLDLDIFNQKIGFDLPKGGRIDYGWNEKDKYLGPDTKRLTWSKEF
jgi:hypothetical protein